MNSITMIDRATAHTLEGISFSQLFSWEWRRAGRSGLLWLAVALLAASFAWGIASTASLHREQSEAQSRMKAYEAERHADVLAHVERFKQPGPELPYWQDPTNVAGYPRYFMMKNAIKPHLPLSVLAVGGSDLQPHMLPVNLDTLFGIDPVYDFENPRGLGLGAFDLAFVVTYLMPLLIVAVLALLCTFERDRDLLRLIAAQPVSPRRWLGARTLAITCWLVPLIAVAFAFALWVIGVSLQSAISEFLTAVVLLVTYGLFWIALSFVVLSRWPSAAVAMSQLIAWWLLLTFGAPILVDLASSVMSPPPSRIAYIDRQRQVTEELTVNRDRILADMFAKRPDLAHATGLIPLLDGVTRNSFFTPEIETRLASLQSDFEQSRADRVRVSTWAGYVVPPLGIAQAFTVLAGTDASRHHQYEAQVRHYQLQLRDYFYPLMQREISAPTPRVINGSMGRFNFDRFDDVPRMQPIDSAAADRVKMVAPLLIWLLVLSAALAGVALRRLRQWPAL